MKAKREATIGAGYSFLSGREFCGLKLRNSAHLKRRSLVAEQGTAQFELFCIGDLMMNRLLLIAGAALFTWTAIAPPTWAGDDAIPPVQPSIPFPQILSPDKFDHPILKRAYAAAARHKAVVAQLPCYCWCSRMGHRSLLDCFASNHGANCDVCIKEVLLADEMVKKGKTAAQIRAAVVHKDYEKIQLK